MAIFPKDRLSGEALIQSVKDRGLGFLDLAGVQLPLPRATQEFLDSVKFVPFVYNNDLALGHHFKILPSGQFKVVNKALLKALRHIGEFQLFSALPVELRIKVFKYALPCRLLHFIEIVLPNGTHQMTITGAKRPAIMEASKEAYDAIMDTSVYQGLFQIGENGIKHFFNPELDHVKLMTYAGTVGHFPSLTLATELRNPLDLKAIRILNLDLQMYEFCLPWVEANLSAMPNLDALDLTASLIDPLATRESHLRLMFKDTFGYGTDLRAFHLLPNGEVLAGVPAIIHATRDIQTLAAKEQVRGLWYALQHSLEHIHNFPSTISLYFWYSPIPAHFAVATGGN
ncbi:hypothetical protein BDZ45DRAFT_169307 [Acephala macrosclerotiorum]|nr:hypothetical protein BDZ45DRAFT_169307 [Acephala macrosclerotiorum]